MKKICLFDYPFTNEVDGYHLETFDPLSYFDESPRWSFKDLLADGLNAYSKKRALASSCIGVDRLYRDRDPSYMRMVNDFVERFRDFDAIVMATYNFIHPEILAKQLSKPIKVLGCIDDPPATYTRTIPNLWAFDGAFYISPSYIDDLRFADALERWGCNHSKWWPLVPFPFDFPQNVDEEFFGNRDLDIFYVGSPTSTKVERLIRLKRHFGAKLHIYGRWPFGGYAGIIRGLYGKPIYPHRVKSLSKNERTGMYWRTKIGLNMHYSDRPSETGNMRMYETTAHGAMMVCDKGCANGHKEIFLPKQEAVYYDSVDDAIELIEYYLHHEEERMSIAKAGFDRYWNEYEWKTNMTNFLNWVVSLRLYR